MARRTQYTPTNDSILLDRRQLQDALQCGEAMAIKFTREAGAEIKMGRRCFYSREKIMAAVREKCN